MNKIIKSFISSVAVAAASLMIANSAMAAKTLKIQLAVPTSSDEAKIVQDFADDVANLTQGEVKLELLPAGAVVGVSDIIDAVDSGLVDGGFAWTHYWSGKHPAAMLFGSPVAGAGVGIDNIAFMSWFQYGGGSQLYDQLWKEMKLNVKGFMLQPVGPEALLRGLDQNAGNFGVDPVPCRSFKFLWCGVFAAWYANDANRVFVGMGFVGNGSSDHHYGFDLPSWLAIGMGANCVDHCANPDSGSGQA